MNEQLPRESQLLCPSCRQPIDEADRFCRHCGRLSEDGVPWYYQPLWIAVLAALFIGPFALRLVWRAPAMDRRTKNILTAGIVLYSIFLLYYTIQVGRGVMQAVGEVTRELEELGY